MATYGHITPKMNHIPLSNHKAKLNQIQKFKTSKPSYFNTSLPNALLKEMNEIAKHIKLSYDNKLGFITSSPFFLGTGILLKMKLCFNTLTMEDIKDTLDAKEFEVIEEKKEGDKLEVLTKLSDLKP